MVKNFKNLLLRNQEADDLETWYPQVLSMFSYDDSALTLTIFMTGAKGLLRNWFIFSYSVAYLMLITN